MKHVLISINPKWCELIANGKKTIEIRKIKPKIDTPFKCYIYCTKDKWQHLVQMPDNTYRIYNGKEYGKYSNTLNFIGESNAKVIGEFVCDCIIPISITYSDPDSRIALKEFPYTCMTDKEIMDYLGNGNQGYGWHISELQIYDEPKELKTFKYLCPHKPRCETCKYSINQEIFCGEVSIGCYRYLQHPPQSWCYVEEIQQ